METKIEYLLEIKSTISDGWIYYSGYKSLDTLLKGLKRAKRECKRNEFRGIKRTTIRELACL